MGKEDQILEWVFAVCSDRVLVKVFVSKNLLNAG